MRVTTKHKDNTFSIRVTEDEANNIYFALVDAARKSANNGLRFEAESLYNMSIALLDQMWGVDGKAS